MALHERARQVIDAYLEIVDREAPGLIEGLYLTGSVALGEFPPHTSDVDFVAVTAAPPDSAAVLALSRAHRRLREPHARPFFDGRYVTWADALQTFPDQWHPVLNEALRIRRADRARADLASACAEILVDLRVRRTADAGSLYSSPMARRREVLAFAEMVIANAHDRFGAPVRDLSHA